MKKKTVMACFFLSGFAAFGQEVISTQGASYSNASGSIDYTLGEVVIATGTDGTNTVTQGFHQTNWNFLSLKDKAPNIDIGVFPNPSSDVLNIQSNSFEGMTFTMIDAQGKIVMEHTLSNELTTVQVAHLVPGNYHLLIHLNGETIKDFNLVKHQ